MRISVWSSDVCSSDLGSPRAILGAVVRNVAILAISSTRSGDIYLVRASVTDDSMQWQVLDTVLNADGDIDVIAYDDTLARQSHGPRPSEPYIAEIGRASCRERGCQ